MISPLSFSVLVDISRNPRTTWQAVWQRNKETSPQQVRRAIEELAHRRMITVYVSGLIIATEAGRAVITERVQVTA